MIDAIDLILEAIAEKDAGIIDKDEALTKIKLYATLQKAVTVKFIEKHAVMRYAD